MARRENPNTERYLSDLNFPARKNEILSAARKNNAPNDVIQRIQEMPDREFNRADDVQEVLRGRTSGRR